MNKMWLRKYPKGKERNINFGESDEKFSPTSITKTQK
jgi:hypothetical protein